MNQTPFTVGATVRLTESAKLTPFWRTDRFKNQTGQVTGKRADGSLTVRMGARGIPKTFYVKPESLEVVA